MNIIKDKLVIEGNTYAIRRKYKLNSTTILNNKFELFQNNLNSNCNIINNNNNGFESMYLSPKKELKNLSYLKKINSQSVRRSNNTYESRNNNQFNKDNDAIRIDDNFLNDNNQMVNKDNPSEISNNNKSFDNKLPNENGSVISISSKFINQGTPGLSSIPTNKKNQNHRKSNYNEQLVNKYIPKRNTIIKRNEKVDIISFDSGCVFPSINNKQYLNIKNII